MKVIVAGSRDFNDYEFVKSKLDELLVTLDSYEIVSGGCRGADKLGERYAKEKGWKCTIFKADWDTFGKFAGPKRNKDMARYAEGLIAFWDGKSRGTANMIDNAQGCGCKIKVVNI